MTAFLVFVAVLAIIVLYALRQKRPLKLDVRLPGAGISLEAGDCPRPRRSGGQGTFDNVDRDMTRGR